MKKNNIIRVGLSVLIVLLSAKFSQAQTMLVPDFRVDNEPAGRASGAPAVQLLTGNRFAAIWTSRNPPAGQKVTASIYDDNGNVIRDDYRIDDATPGIYLGDTGSGGTTIDSNGNFFVTWRSSVDGLTNFYGRIRKFLPNGDPVGISVDASELGNLPNGVVQTGHGKNDQIIVSYGKAGKCYFRFFDNNLIPMIPSNQVNQTTVQIIPGLAVDLSGNFIVVWEASAGPMMARLYDQDGNPRTDEITVVSSYTNVENPRVIYNKQGNFMVVWWSFSQYGMYRVFDSNGNPLTDALYLGPAVAEPNEWWGRPSVDADDNGNFVTIYEYRSDLTSNAIYGTILDPNGSVLEQFFQVSQPTPVMLWSLSVDIACMSGGKFVALWSDGRNDANGDIYAAILRNNHWVEPGPFPTTGPVALAILAVLLAAILIRSLKIRERKARV